MQVQAIFCNQIQYRVFRTSVRARILKFLSKPSPTPIYYPQVFASALSRNSSDKAIAVLPASRAHPLARWHRFVSIERPEPLQTALQGTSARAMVYRKNSCLHTGCLLWILGTITLLSEGNTRLVEAVHRYNANSFQEVPRCLSSL